MLSARLRHFAALCFDRLKNMIGSEINSFYLGNSYQLFNQGN